MITRWCLLIGALIWAVPVQAQVLFDENFEVPLGEVHSTGPVIDALKAKGWAGYIEASTQEIGSIISKTSRTGAASRVIRYRYGFMDIQPFNVRDSTNVKLTRFFPGITDMWTRAWLRWEKLDPNAPSFWVKFPSSPNSKQQYFNPGIGESVGTSVGFHSSTNPVQLFAFLSTRFLRYCRAGQTLLVQTCNYYANTPTPVNMTIHDGPSDRPTQWACVEVHYKGNFPLDAYNGQFQIWVNGVQTINYTDLKMFTESPIAGETNTFRYVQVYRQSAENMFRYEDDFGVSTARIGCGATPLSLDTQPPTGPTGLRLN